MTVTVTVAKKQAAGKKVDVGAAAAKGMRGLKAALAQLGPILPWPGASCSGGALLLRAALRASQPRAPRLCRGSAACVPAAASTPPDHPLRRRRIPLPAAPERAAGGSAVELLTGILDAVDTAVVNQANLSALGGRAFDLLKMINQAQADLRARGAYAKIVSALTDTLRDIRDYARAYADLSVFAKLLFAAGHKERFEDLSQQLRDVTAQATLAMSTETAAKMNEMLDRLRAATAYVVRWKRRPRCRTRRRHLRRRSALSRPDPPSHF